MLAQHINEDEHPVIYLSRIFTPPEQTFSVTEEECAVIIFAIKKLRYYIDEQQSSIETDHKTPIWLKKNAGNNPRLSRWALISQPYQYTFKDRPGRLIPHVDCLGRIE